MIVRGLVLALATIGCCDCGNRYARALGTFAGKAMDVTEGQREVDGQRDQREPRALPDMLPKPMHSEAVFLQSEAILSEFVVR